MVRPSCRGVSRSIGRCWDIEACTSDSVMTSNDSLMLPSLRLLRREVSRSAAVVLSSAREALASTSSLALPCRAVDRASPSLLQMVGRCKAPALSFRLRILTLAALDALLVRVRRTGEGFAAVTKGMKQ